MIFVLHNAIPKKELVYYWSGVFNFLFLGAFSFFVVLVIEEFYWLCSEVVY